MSRRYGRNQRRAHRQEIERLNAQVVEVERRERMANFRAEEAYSKAVREIAESGGYIDYALRRISEELARAYPQALREAAERVMSSRREQPPIRFDAFVDWSKMEQCVVIRGEIPALRYNIAVM